jgi:hypothetical protein
MIQEQLSLFGAASRRGSMRPYAIDSAAAARR